jgi:hypothetical protein
VREAFQLQEPWPAPIEREPIRGNKRYTLEDLSRGGTLKPRSLKPRRGSEKAFRSSESCCIQLLLLLSVMMDSESCYHEGGGCDFAFKKIVIRTNSYVSMWTLKRTVNGFLKSLSAADRGVHGS